MYNQKLVASLKANGKILREFKDTVYIPFGQEYSIVLKNLDTVRALVNITLDGTDVCPGGLVLSPGQTVDLERWIKNGNLTEGNRFKFIERTAQIEKHKGIGLEDGIINITYQFEQPSVRYTTQSNTLRNITAVSGTMPTGSIARSVSQNSNATWASPQSGHDGVTCSSASCNDVGITVPGSRSEQTFQTTNWFPTLTEKHSIVLRLLGETPDNKPVEQAVTVKSKPKCTTCGKVNKATSAFCSACGTALTVL
jgi:hypothetical protein